MVVRNTVNVSCGLQYDATLIIYFFIVHSSLKMQHGCVGVLCDPLENLQKRYITKDGIKLI